MINKKKLDSGYEDLYVSMTNVSDKRKSILEGIKASLMMQQEHDAVMEIRRNKALITKEIKNSLDRVNKLYADLRKELPNVKNVLSYTEKEINELEQQIKSLKIDTRANIENIRLESSMKRKLETSKHGLNEMKEKALEKKAQKEQEHSKTSQHSGKLILSTETSHKLSKLDRIQNNLKVIESKLKNL